MPVTAIYAAIIAILVVVLAVRVVPLRRSRRVGLGDGGDKDLIPKVGAARALLAAKIASVKCVIISDLWYQARHPHARQPGRARAYGADHDGCL
jgi:hypothetical protein